MPEETCRLRVKVGTRGSFLCFTVAHLLRGNNRPLWRPFSHSAVFLITFIFLSIGLFVFLQVLLVQSQRNNGVYFAKNISDLSFGKTFSYNYLPTIIAVLYSLAWSWVDADSKRLETFYQLSAPDGVCAEDSLNLEYAFAFGPVVPINSLRKRSVAQGDP